jgi:diguanylate cyclase (GGDEF)-like protein
MTNAANGDSHSPDDGRDATNAGPSAGQVACSMTSTLIARVRATHGERGVAELLVSAEVPYGAEHLCDPGNWIWFDEAVGLFEAAVELTGDAKIARRAGEESVRQHAGTPVATLLRSLGSPEAILEQVAAAVTKFSTVTEMTAADVAPGRAIVEGRARPGFARHPQLCLWTQGLLSQPTVLFGLPPAKVEEITCQTHGDACCTYTVTWDADAASTMADPHQLIAALESQLTAMKDRLESVYATAQDLIASDDVDAALARITERAATAVRAPKYLLAVQLDHGEKTYVHHRGFTDKEPELAAAALLSRARDDSDSSRLVAEVASSRRHYGWLMAESPAGGFFSQERELLDVYARFAATVLDTATALENASWRADHDPLTELNNRRRLTAELERQLSHTARYGRSGALLMIDLDNFKLVNDSHGHAAGDRLLKAIAQALSTRVRTTDVVARLGGDEFAVILPETDATGARIVAESLAERLREIPTGLDEPISVSVGLAVFGAEDRFSVDEVMVAADLALYRAKESGGNRIESCDGWWAPTPGAS